MKTLHFYSLKRTIAAGLAVLMFSLSVGTPRLQAMVMPTQQLAPTTLNRSADLATVQTVLEQKEIRQRLHDLGLSDDQINRRLNRLTDTQLHQVAMQIDQQMPAGDDSGTIISILVIALLIVLLIRLID